MKEEISTALEAEARAELVDTTEEVDAEEDVADEISDSEDEVGAEEDEVLLLQLRTADSSDMLPLDEAGLQTNWQDAALRDEGT